MNTNLLFLTLILTLLPSLYLQQTFIHCPQNTSPPIACPEIFQPVCATLVDGSKKTYGNECLACQDQDVIKYTQGQCTIDPQTCPLNTSPPIIPIVCPAVFQPVCATLVDGTRRTFGNECLACSDPDVVSFFDGACTIDPITGNCPTDDLGNCVKSYVPVCGTFFNSSLCLDDPCVQTFTNECFACQSDLVDTWTQGECQLGNQKFCPLDNRPEVCNLLFAPVCATLTNNTQRTYGNSCSACSDSNVESYTDGQCIIGPVDDIRICPAIRPQVCTEELEFRCGVFDDRIQCGQGGPCEATFTNHCKACMNDFIAYTIPGRCEDRPPILPPPLQCPDPRQFPCNLDINWVCATLKDENCLNPPCFITYRNQCIACSDSRVIEYFEGRCEQDSQLKLMCPSNRPTSCPLSNFPVCGFFSNSSATQTFLNECWACRNTNVQFFIKGRC